MQVSFITPPALAKEPLGDVARWAADAGFDAIDAEVDWDVSAADALSYCRLSVGPMRIRASLADSDESSRKHAIETALRAIDRAVELGLETVWTLPRNFRNDTSQRENFRATVRSLPEEAGHAERQNIRIAIENCPFDGQNVICTPEAWDAVFAAVPSEAIGICMDPSHCIWQGIDYLRAMREYRSRLYHVHAKDTELLSEGQYRYGVEGPRIEEPGKEDDGPRHGWWRHRLPGLGAVDWNAFITTLADAGYARPISVEHEDPLWGGSPERVRRGLAQGAAHLRQFIP